MADVSKISANSVEYTIKDATARSSISSIQSDINTINGDITAIEGDVSTLQGQMATAQGNISTLQNTATGLQNQINLLQTESANGYCKLPDGTMIQWGQASSFTLSNGILSATISMAQNFVGLNYSVMLTPQRNGIAYVTTPFYEANANGNVERTVNSFAIAAKGTNTNITVNWFAIGRWK